MLARDSQCPYGHVMQEDKEAGDMLTAPMLTDASQNLETAQLSSSAGVVS